MAAHMHLRGTTVDDLYVVKDVGNDDHHNVLWECRCVCGAYVQKTSNALNARRKTKCEHTSATVGEMPSETSAEFVRKWKSGNRPAPIQSSPEPTPVPIQPTAPAPVEMATTNQESDKEDWYEFEYNRMEALEGFVPDSSILNSDSSVGDWIAYYVSVMDEKLKNEFLAKLILKEIAHKFL
jgi:hypothetical protein